MTRRITEEEKELWKLATRGVKGEAGLDEFIPNGLKIKITDKIETKTLPKPLAKKKSTIPTIIDQHNLRKLAKGKINIEARLDLHGMWLTEAHKAVTNFIFAAHHDGKRRLLIITGKGGLDGGGKIRAEFPKWLHNPELSHIVSSFSQSGAKHGGGGAFYVYLRKH